MGNTFEIKRNIEIIYDSNQDKADFATGRILKKCGFALWDEKPLNFEFITVAQSKRGSKTAYIVRACEHLTPTTKLIIKRSNLPGKKYMSQFSAFYFALYDIITGYVFFFNLDFFIPDNNNDFTAIGASFRAIFSKTKGGKEWKKIITA